MTYSDYIGKAYPSYSVEVEKGRIRFFAQSIGTDDPIHQDEAAAKDAGYSTIPAPPTFAFTVLMEGGGLFNILQDLDIPPTKTVHGSQGFRYFRPILAGDVITGHQKITDIYDKKGGALVFIDVENRLENDRGEDVCVLNSTIVIRNG